MHTLTNKITSPQQVVTYQKSAVIFLALFALWIDQNMSLIRRYTSVKENWLKLKRIKWTLYEINVNPFFDGLNLGKFEKKYVQSVWLTFVLKRDHIWILGPITYIISTHYEFCCGIGDSGHGHGQAWNLKLRLLNHQVKYSFPFLHNLMIPTQNGFYSGLSLERTVVS